MKLIGTVAFCLVTAIAPVGYTKNAPITSSLQVSCKNSRYFTDSSGEAIYLTGSHTWSNFKDMGKTDPPKSFDFDGYLDFLQKYNHNFIRLWTWELSKYSYKGGTMTYAQPFPWPRTGPGKALDGKPKFDLKKFNQSYFDRLRSRITTADNRRIYVSVMLFEGHGLQASLPPWCWEGHPFNIENNINGINGDLDGDGRGLETHTLKNPAITSLQKAYVEKVIDTVNDLNNVLFEITNESGTYSTQWQYHMINFIHKYEKTKSKQHPVGMTFQWSREFRGSNDDLFKSPADWISPSGDGGYRDNPPLADGSKVIISDTDHLWGIGGNHAWVWKSFCRGMNPIFMDPYRPAQKDPEENKRSTWTEHLTDEPALDPRWEPIRENLGYTLKYANRMNLTNMVPRDDLASTKYCLTNPPVEYVVYLPDGGEVTVNLTAASGRLNVEWLNPRSGKTTTAPPTKGGKSRRFQAPFQDDAVVYIVSDRRSSK